MATVTPVDIGSAPNDGTGDPLRTAFTKLNTNDTNINNQLVAHIDDVSAAHAALAISYTPSGSVGSNNVQDAISEVATEAVQTAAQVAFTPTTNIASTDVQAAIDEVEKEAPRISSEDTLAGQMQIAVVATLPGTPDANTLYFVTT